MSRPMTEEQFLKDVAAHKMSALELDVGIHRHLRFIQPATNNMWFDIVTWPGSLTIHGDMGTWSFSRLPDMFNFFRGNRINASSWSEKITSESRFGGPHEKFQQRHFQGRT